MVDTPEVSVVIPTRNRPELVSRAVDSALAQTLRQIEVIVVIDGCDPATRQVLSSYDDPRLRVAELPVSAGAPTARNVGARHARAEWTALLDDDDEWLPNKLETQLALARTARFPEPVVASRLYLRTPRAQFVVPRRLPAEGEHISEYLAVRRGLFHGDGLIQTSSLLVRTELLRRVPFTPGLRRLQEFDWTLRCLEVPGTGLVFAAEPLVVWHADENRPRVTFDAPWRECLDWLNDSRSRFTPRAYAALAMSVISSMAAPSHSPRAFLRLLGQVLRHGRPGLLDYVTFLQVWLVPAGARRAVRDLVLGRRWTRQARLPAGRTPQDETPAVTR
jgi:glycosyltransferase involved in cell wall biosynthesis